MEEITDKKLNKALHYKELLDKAEEVKKRGEKLKFAKRMRGFDFYTQQVKA